MQEEIKCTEDGIEFGYKLTIAGTYIGDKDELINKDKVIQWHELYEADFTVKELSWKEKTYLHCLIQYRKIGF